MPFINKTIKRSGFMKRSCMRNNYLKNSFDNNKRAHNKQRNYYVLFLRKKKEL